MASRGCFHRRTGRCLHRFDQTTSDALGRDSRRGDAPSSVRRSRSEPTWSSTRVVTVDATPDQIWPWLAQVGWGRAGYYGYDWIDNGGKASAWEILSLHQAP